MSVHIELSKRAVLCEGWWWMAGMLCRAAYPIRICSVRDGEPCAYVIDGDILRDCDGTWAKEGSNALPDFDDAATVGCLLALVREAWGPETYVERQSRWRVVCRRPGWADDIVMYDEVGLGATEAEALVTALEAAP